MAGFTENYDLRILGWLYRQVPRQGPSQGAEHNNVPRTFCWENGDITYPILTQTCPRSTGAQPGSRTRQCAQNILLGDCDITYQILTVTSDSNS